MAVITLLTDFGTRDEYVGVMKGVILSIVPQASIVDLTHEIDPQDVVQGSYLLDAAVEYFPEGSTHLAVVDPGVGGARAAVAIRRNRHFFVAPDNGILTLILAQKIDLAVRIENERIFRKPVSPTFHGRDIFAPAAAYLAAGHAIEGLGPIIPSDELVRTRPNIPAKRSGARIEGCVVAIDRFGNLMTNITAEACEALKASCPGRDIGVGIGETSIAVLSNTYCEVAEGQMLALIGSRGYLEISVNQAGAAEQLNVVKGDRVAVLALNNLGLKHE